MAKKPCLVVSKEAFRLAQLYSSITGTPINQVVSDAIGFWWSSYGEFIIKREKELDACLTENPAATKSAYTTWVKAMIRPN